MQLNCTLKTGQNGKFYYTYILPQLKKKLKLSNWPRQGLDPEPVAVEDDGQGSPLSAVALRLRDTVLTNAANTSKVNPLLLLSCRVT